VPRFREDRRAVTVQIGAILLFGIVVLSLAAYQATAVPADNERVEFNHNQEVQSDLLELRGALAPTATPSSVSVDLGTTYPSRVLFVNPAPPGGRLATGPPRTTTLSNVEATNPETADFVDGRYAVDSRAVSYDPSYNVYDEAPTTTLEGPVAVNRGGNGSVAITGQRLVEGRTISVVVVRGDLSRAGSRPLTVDPRRVSETTRTEVRNATAGNLTLTVPTGLPASAWARLLADEPAVTGVAPAGPDAVNVSLAGLAPGTEPYSLRVGVVDVTGGVPAPAPRYVTSPDAPTATLAPGDEVTVAVRDRYNNPVAGRLNVTGGAGLLAGDDDGTPTVYEPDDREDGVYRLRYRGGDGTITASVPNATGPEENVSVVVTEVSAPGGGGGSVSVETITSDGFESGLGNWSTNSQGNVGTSGARSHLGDRSALLNGEPEGLLVSDDLDTGAASYLEVEYWAYRTDGPELDENEYLRFQYQRTDGSWETVDVIRLRDADGDGSPDPRSFSRRILVSDPGALRDGVRFRFTASPDASSDEWYVDDVRIYGIGSGGSGGSGPPSGSQVSLASGQARNDRGPGGGAAESFEFVLSNGGSSPAEVSAIEVVGTADNPNDGSVDEIRGKTRTVETFGSGSNGAITGSFSIDSPQTFGSGSRPTIVAGGSKRVVVGYVGTGNGQPSDRDLSGDTIRVEVTFAGGSTETYSFTAS
jgi:hypothetical protein